jgi:diguanylate cyclase (GGDEF)-like protein
VLLARLAGEARTDPLTGLLNRRGFDEHASRELAHLGRDGHSMALAIFDLDHFKHINDQWGHIVGDRVLVHMARLLTSESRAIDVAARLGGEEFAVLMPGGHQAGATGFAERVRRALATADCSDVPEVRVSAGITVTVDPLDVQTMLERADQALYAAKRGGRNRTVAFEQPGLSLAA